MVAGSATMKANVESDTRRCHGSGDVYLCNALLVPLKSPASFCHSEQWRQILQLRREEYREFFSSDAQLVLFFEPNAALLSFEQILTGDHTSVQIVSGLDVTCVLVNLPSIHE